MASNSTNDSMFHDMGVHIPQTPKRIKWDDNGNIIGRRLTQDEKAKVLYIYDNTSASQSAIAAMFGVSRSAIGNMTRAPVPIDTAAPVPIDTAAPVPIVEEDDTTPDTTQCYAVPMEVAASSAPNPRVTSESPMYTMKDGGYEYVSDKTMQAIVLKQCAKTMHGNYNTIPWEPTVKSPFKQERRPRVFATMEAQLAHREAQRLYQQKYRTKCRKEAHDKQQYINQLECAVEDFVREKVDSIKQNNRPGP
ncbi:hypothetical protein T484DRAFT_1855034 [Baffinella frigidus]|nr:hypothetical protein T484DRAFT_1855034 [Cryptophyta sp. CCMP2293]